MQAEAIKVWGALIFDLVDAEIKLKHEISRYHYIEMLLQVCGVQCEYSRAAANGTETVMEYQCPSR